MKYIITIIFVIPAVWLSVLSFALHTLGDWIGSIAGHLINWIDGPGKPST